MTLDALLRAHAFMKVERPPQLWAVDTEDVRFVPLLGEMIAAALSGGAPLADVTLNASNVSVGPDAACSTGPPAGEYVAITVSGLVDLGPDATWTDKVPAPAGRLADLQARLAAAGARYAYIRRMPPTGSITVYLSRLR